MAAPELLFRVRVAHHLPGLGVLALPEPGAARLPQALHTALQVHLQLPNGSQYTAPATVEEVTHDGAATSALLVHLEEGKSLPAGTEIWLEATSATEL
jgi:hypothetical protein